MVVGGLQVVGDDCRWSSGVVGCCRCSRVVVDANRYQLEKRMRIREKREGKMRLEITGGEDAISPIWALIPRKGERNGIILFYNP